MSPGWKILWRNINALTGFSDIGETLREENGADENIRSMRKYQTYKEISEP